MANDKIIKKFNQLSDEAKQKHRKHREGRIKGGSYQWDTEEEREDRKRGKSDRIPSLV